MTNVTKVSNIVSIKQNSNLAKSYFGSVGKFSAYTVSRGDVVTNMFIIEIGKDYFEIPLGELQVNGVTATSMSDGMGKLSAVFSS
jgi:hypothetical protein